MDSIKSEAVQGTLVKVQAPDLYPLIEDKKSEGFTGLVSVEGVGLLLFVEGEYIPVMLYDGPIPDTMRVWVRPFSRSVVNLIFSRGTVSTDYIVYNNGAAATIPLPSLGVEEQEMVVAFLYQGKEKLRKVMTKWLQERFPYFRIVEGEPEESSIVVFSLHYMDRVMKLPRDVLRILILDKGEKVDREKIEEAGVMVFEYPYTRIKFFKLLDQWDNRN